jgi:hypothetical protein
LNLRTKENHAEFHAPSNRAPNKRFQSALRLDPRGLRSLYAKIKIKGKDVGYKPTIFLQLKIQKD